MPRTAAEKKESWMTSGQSGWNDGENVGEPLSAAPNDRWVWLHSDKPKKLKPRPKDSAELTNMGFTSNMEKVTDVLKHQGFSSGLIEKSALDFKKKEAYRGRGQRPPKSINKIDTKPVFRFSTKKDLV